MDLPLGKRRTTPRTPPSLSSAFECLHRDDPRIQTNACVALDHCCLCSARARLNHEPVSTLCLPAGVVSAS